MQRNNNSSNEMDSVYNETLLHLQKKVLELEAQLTQKSSNSGELSEELDKLKSAHIQLQKEYSVVHDQLKLSIDERDQACQHFVVEKNKNQVINNQLTDLKKQLETSVGTKEVKKSMQRNNNSSNEMDSVYNETLLHLQKKVLELEEHCRKRDDENFKL